MVISRLRKNWHIYTKRDKKDIFLAMLNKDFFKCYLPAITTPLSLIGEREFRKAFLDKLSALMRTAPALTMSLPFNGGLPCYTSTKRTVILKISSTFKKKNELRSSITHYSRRTLSVKKRWQASDIKLQWHRINRPDWRDLFGGK